MNTSETACFRDVLEGVPGRDWHRLSDGRIQCDLCPRYCKLHDGQRGLCFVRARRGDEILLTTYGRSSGFCIDPIEKKPLNHFLPGTPVLSFGTAGCNLTCKFCQNGDISKARSLDRLQSEAAPETIVHAAQETGSRAIAYTYNDPVIFLEYAVDTARVARNSIKNVAVTAGYISEKARKSSFGDGCGQHRFEGFHRWFLSNALLRRAQTHPRDPRIRQARDRRLARDHDAIDPWPQ